uniref:Uncharacterized protein n=1 Tax=Pavo cristatus TaxID=9049 RepID=A0A8C9EKH7_PAVCR
ARPADVTAKREPGETRQAQGRKQQSKLCGDVGQAHWCAPLGELPAGGCCHQLVSQPAIWCSQLPLSSPGSETPKPSCCGRPHEADPSPIGSPG